MAGTDNLERFVQAQDQSGTYDRALGELRHGRKTSHWMWFVFPQLAGLGRSPTAQHFAIADLPQARDYLAHPVLGERLRTCVRTLADLDGGLTAVAVFGEVDAMKLRSCLTLFAAAGDSDGLFGRALERYFPGPDELTLRLLGLSPV